MRQVTREFTIPIERVDIWDHQLPPAITPCSCNIDRDGRILEMGERYRTLKKRHIARAKVGTSVKLNSQEWILIQEY